PCKFSYLKSTHCLSSPRVMNVPLTIGSFSFNSTSTLTSFPLLDVPSGMYTYRTLPISFPIFKPVSSLFQCKGNLWMWTHSLIFSSSSENSTSFGLQLFKRMYWPSNVHVLPLRTLSLSASFWNTNWNLLYPMFLIVKGWLVFQMLKRVVRNPPKLTFFSPYTLPRRLLEHSWIPTATSSTDRATPDSSFSDNRKPFN
ncbi:Unknown protein, partial [Striga hermonthica]